VGAPEAPPESEAMKPKPDAEEVRALLVHCLFKEGEPTEPRITVEGITANFALHTDRVAEKRAAIAEQLAGLPAPFHQGRGDGWSFLNACVDEHDRHWGEHASMEMLFALGIAAGLGRWVLPRDVWASLPGGVPYFVVFKPKDPPP